MTSTDKTGPSRRKDPAGAGSALPFVATPTSPRAGTTPLPPINSPDEARALAQAVADYLSAHPDAAGRLLRRLP
ncbi:MAG: hypothetical protein Q7T19_06860 [Caulobacter sp.]|nr:hypothetical protein [Caulobacter sp.]